MIHSCQKPPVYFPTVTGAICSFNSQYAGLPLKSCVVSFDEQSAISSLDFTANGTTRTFTFDEAITTGSLDVLTGVLTKSDSSTVNLGGMEINTILGLNSLISSVGNISAEYLKAGR
jgi:hypothetical protein